MSRLFHGIFCAVLTISCATKPVLQPVKDNVQTINKSKAIPLNFPQTTSGATDLQTRKEKQEEATDYSQQAKSFVKIGSGKFIDDSSIKADQAPTQEGDITLNFEAVNLREMVKAVFEEILKENYIIDPKVQGTITIHTTNPVKREAVLPILESVLQSNGAALIKDGALYKIVPQANAKKEPLLASVGPKAIPGRVGYSTQIVPLKFVSAKEIKKVLSSVISDAVDVQVNESRNLLIVTGTRKGIESVLKTVDIFDEDWLKGMSFALFPLQYGDARAMADELSKVVGKENEGPLGGIIRLIPIERLNSILVITHQPKYLDEARKLVEQFDRGADSAPGRRLYVYDLKHGKAEDLASILQEIFGQQSDTTGRTDRRLDTPPSQRNNIRSPSLSTISSKADAKANQRKNVEPATNSIQNQSDNVVEANTPEESNGPVTIIADKNKNSILVLASPRDYRIVESTIRRLDVPAHQVLIEATIAEVQLTDNLSYGVRWFLDGSSGRTGVQGGFNAPLPSSVGGQGFALGILNSLDELRFFFDILESESNVKFLSAPQIMVVNNQTASFRAGDQIPIVTRSSQSTTNPDAPIVSEVQFRDTGTLLQVTPRVNAGQMVTLEISQEVSVPGTRPAVGGGGNVPISQRTIDSTVVVRSGQTIVLGGLISEDQTTSVDGIPGLMDIPGVGKLFSSTIEDVSRTELIVTITPRVITNPQEAVAITTELRRRLRDAATIEASARK